MARKGKTRAPSRGPVILHVGISFCNYRYDKRKPDVSLALRFNLFSGKFHSLSWREGQLSDKEERMETILLSPHRAGHRTETPLSYTEGSQIIKKPPLPGLSFHPSKEHPVTSGEGQRPEHPAGKGHVCPPVALVVGLTQEAGEKVNLLVHHTQ